MQQVIEFFRGLFATDGWPPRWHCGKWSSFHGWLYILSDISIWIAYFLIPLIILNYLGKKKNGIKFQKVYLLFAAFILLCGITHFLDAMMFWIPMYRLNALVRFFTGVVSMLTVYYLFKILPQAFRQKSNAELEREVARRIQAEQSLAEANASLTSFAYIASHDLQEPLRKIRTFGSQVQDGYTNVLDERGNELVEKIMKSAARMQSMTTDILNLSAYTDRINMGQVSITEAARIAILDLESKITESGARVTVAENIPDAYGNLSYLSHLFLNLISNSIKFSKEQPVINIWGEAHDGVVSVYIEDNGIGIEEAGHQKIFHAFQKMHGKNEYEGSGLGLAICKRIVDIHHGHLSVSSVVGEGSTFIVELPRNAEHLTLNAER
jgi:two-component system, chemotaxis family, sensor kinase Cph1